MSRAIIMIPTHNHALMLPHAIRSAQQQTVSDVRIAVLGDGVGNDTRDVMADFIAADSRIDFLDLPKAGRTGEPHRHHYLSSVGAADIVTYLSDDDLMLPEHVEVMLDALARLDFTHGAPGYINEHGTLCSDPVDFADPETARLEFAMSLVSLTGLGHTLEAYRRLPYGWRSTPKGTYTDQYMVQQFLSQPWCRAGAADRLTVVRLPDTLRQEMTAQQRADELARWADRLATEDGRQSFRDDAIAAFRRSAAAARRSEIVLTQLLAGVQSERDRWTVERTHSTSEVAHTAHQLAGVQSQLATLQAELDRATVELGRQSAELHRVEAERKAQETYAAEALGERDHANAMFRQLAATRAVRIRDRAVRNRVLRMLLARGGEAR
jgi:GalNAc5-diNAcBac-PP-undecaprenol beta-1,3-glucosyltransferase